MEKKLSLFSDYLTEDLKIKSGDKEKIFACLIDVEDNIFELYHFIIEERDDLQVSQSFINSILMDIDKINELLDNKFKKR